MCRESRPLCVVVPGDLAWEGRDTVKTKAIDACIWSLVAALAVAGIRTRGSCCGHGKRDGSIVLQDGRELTVCGSPKTDQTTEDSE